MRCNRWTATAAGLALWCLSAAPAGELAASKAVYVEYSPAAQDLLAEAARLRDQGRLVEAASVYQRVIDEYPRRLMEGDAGSYGDAWRATCRLLLADPDLLDTYRKQHQPAAQRLLDDAIAQGSNTDALERLYQRYALCPSGVQAAMIAAGAYLEQAAPQDAAALLDEVRGLAGSQPAQAGWLELRAAAAIYSGDQARYETCTRALRRAGAAPTADRLDQWARESLPLATAELKQHAGTDGPLALPDHIGGPLWELALPQTPDPRASTRGRITASQSPTSSYPVRPVAEGGRLFINAHSALVALDTVSGAHLWSYSDALKQNPQSARAIVQYNHSVSDSRGVLAARGAVVAVLGQSSNVRRGWRSMPSQTALVCIDQATGDERWIHTPQEIDDSFAGAEFIGTPAGRPQGGRVFVLLGRNQATGFQDLYAASIDLDTGRPLWHRHLASVASGFQNLIRHAELVYDEGLIYVADSYGITARLDARSGSIHWMTQGNAEPPPQQAGNRMLRPGHMPASMPCLVRCPAGLVVMAGQAGQRRVSLIDPASGSRLRSLNAPYLREAAYIAPTALGVLVVGKTVAMLDGHTLTPRWTRRLGVSNDVDPQGGPAITDDRVVLTTRNRLIALSLDDGAVVAEHAMPKPGTVLALPEQLIVAGAESISSYLTWDRAYAHLTHQIARRPHEPAIGLALAHLAGAAGKHEFVLEGIDAAIGALELLSVTQPTLDDAGDPENAAQAARLAVFRRILSLVDARHTPDSRIRRLLFDRLASTTGSPSDEVAYQMALADFYVETDKPLQAVDRYQAILEDPVMESQWYTLGDGSFQAGFVARRRLGELVESHGRRVYDRYETIAAQRYVELTTGTADAAALYELALRYPVSRTSGIAMLAAANKLASGNQHATALHYLRRAYRLATEAGLLQRVVGRLVEMHQQIGQPGEAKRWLTRVSREHPGLMPLRDGRPTTINEWLTLLDREPDAPDRLPSFQLPVGRAVFLPHCSLLTPTRQPLERQPRDRVITQSGVAAQLRAAPDFMPVWEAQLPVGQRELLALESGQALFWVRNAQLNEQRPDHGPAHMSPRTGQTDRHLLVGIDALTGDPQWPALDAVSLLDQASRHAGDHDDLPTGVVLQRINPDGRIVQGPQPPAAEGRMHVAVNNMVVVVADESGRVAAVDRHTGEQLWAHDSRLQQVGHLVIDDSVLAVAGLRTQRNNSRQAAVVILDALTGETLHEPVTERGGITWLGLSGTGTLAYATPDSVACYDTDSGEPLWQRTMAGVRFDSHGWLDGRLLFMQARVAHKPLLVFDQRTGEPLARITSTNVNHSREPIIVNDRESRWYGLSNKWCTSIGPSGRTFWRDAVSDGAGERALGVVTQDNVVIVDRLSRSGAHLRAAMQARQAGQPRADGVAIQFGGMPADTASQKLYFLNRETGVLEAEYLLDPGLGTVYPQDAAALDGYLVLPVSGRVLVLPDSSQASESEPLSVLSN